ncbi:ABC transporter permease [Streptacidiphilus carbonis]|uniref:ABC transporter permease n=1 Tax=Streptacidiphilus carbonis TaxID=105422 RepID=UPI00126A4D5D|nr:ABC transporter permease [Streptacidiphilus carbonis]
MSERQEPRRGRLPGLRRGYRSGPGPGSGSGSGAARPPAVAPWTRTRLRSAMGAALALVVLVLATTFIAAGFPRWYDRYQDGALHSELAKAGVSGSAVEAVAGFARDGTLTKLDDASTVSPSNLAAVRAKLAGILTEVPAETSGGSTGVHTTGVRDFLMDPGLARPEGIPPLMTLDWQDGEASRLKVVRGRMPQPPRAGTAAPHELEIAVSAATAGTVHIRLGQVLHLAPQRGSPVLLHVVGVYQPLNPNQDYWSAEPRLIAPVSTFTLPPTGGLDPASTWHVEALVAAGTVPYFPAVGTMEAYWWFLPQQGVLHAHDIPGLQSRLANVLTGDGQAAAKAPGAGFPQGQQFSSGLPDALTQFTSEADAIAPVLTVGLAGTAGIAGAVLLMAAGLAADRRDGELRLLRARGGSMPALGRRLLGEALCCTTPGAVAGIGLALLLLPTGRTLPALTAGLAVWAVATAAMPLRGLFRHRRIRAAGRPEDVTTARPSRRRTVAELAVVLVAVAAVVAVRRQGLVSSGGVDLLLTGAPLLMGLAGAFLLMRLYPWPLRLAARPSQRRGGAVGFLGLARAGRASSTASVLPLMALLLALTVAVFGSEVLSGIGEGREQAALAEVGADAQVSGTGAQIPAAVVAAVRSSPGVRSVLPVAQSRVQFPQNDAVADFYAVDPSGYRGVSDRVDGGSFPAGLLHYSGSGPIPVLVSADVAATMGSAPMEVQNDFGTFRIRVAGVLDSVLMGKNPFLLASSEALDAQPHASAAADAPLTLYVTGPVDGRALRSAVSRAAGSTALTVDLRTEALATLHGDRLSDGAATLYLATVLAGAALAVLAVLLSLLQAAPGRAALLVRLRTMGMTPRQGYRLILVEALPQVVAAVLAGTALGLAAVPLLGPSVDLSALVGVTVDAGLRATALPVLGPGLVLLVLAVAVVVVEAAVIGKRQIGVELRVGDQR